MIYLPTGKIEKDADLFIYIDDGTDKFRQFVIDTSNIELIEFMTGCKIGVSANKIEGLPRYVHGSFLVQRACLCVDK